ncbi:RBSK, partial [Symbiodinium microadriaticum]
DWPTLSESELSRLLQGAAAVLLQREIPEEVNIAFAQAAKAAGTRVFLDAGGQDAPISDSLLRLVDVFCPNESELQRLTGLSTSTRADVLAAAQALLARGAAAVHANKSYVRGTKTSVLLWQIFSRGAKD